MAAAAGLDGRADRLDAGDALGHHALTDDDGIGHYMGNFGNLLFVWDVVFRTAKITRRYPAAVGLPDDRCFGKERWFVEMFYPLVQSRRTRSSLAPGRPGVRAR